MGKSLSKRYMDAWSTLVHKAGPVTSRKRMTFFDSAEIEAVTVKFDIPREELEPQDIPPMPAGAVARAPQLQILVNHEETDGYSLSSFKYNPGAYVPRHFHDHDQLIYIVAGEIRQGNKVLGPGCGYFVPAGHSYMLQVGDQGAHVLEFRHVPADAYTTTWTESVHAKDADPAPAR